MGYGNLFNAELRPGIYLISSDEFGVSLDFGAPTGNSYLVVGEEEALLFDTAVMHPEIKEYAERLAGKRVRLVLSHGHGDHTFCAGQFAEVWMHPADEYLLSGALGFPPVAPAPAVRRLLEGDVMDLGNRRLEVYHVPGHTAGSILLLDRNTRTLLGGDTVTRRLLYGLNAALGLEEAVSLKAFCANLIRIDGLGFDSVLSAHDRHPLDGHQARRMADYIRNELLRTKARISFFGVDNLHLTCGECRDADFFDMTVPETQIFREKCE